MSVLDSAAREAIEKNYSVFLREHPEFRFNESDLDQNDPGLFTMELAEELAEVARIHEPVADVSHRKYLGKFVVSLKALLRKLARPFVRSIFIRQQRVNDLLVSLAYNTASLELRLSQLEEIQRKNKGN